MTFPQELASYLKTLPFLGKIRCSHRELVAGEFTELVLTYEVGSSALADGAGIKIAFKFYSDWGLFQTTEPAAANYVSAKHISRVGFPGESPETVRSLHVRFDQKGHERPYQKALFVDAVDGYLKPGDLIEIRLGDRSYGSPGTRVQTFIEEAFNFRIYVDNAGSSKFAALSEEISLRIIPGPAYQGFLVGPRISGPDVPFFITLRWEDRWGNPAQALDIYLLSLQGGQEETREKVVWEEQGNSWSRTSCRIKKIGTYVFSLPAAPLPVKPIHVSILENLTVPRAFFADLHIHSDDTVGINSTEYNLDYARNAAALDIAGYTANDFNVRSDRWEHAVGVCRQLNEPGRFLCFPGTEWCGSSSVGGDRNVIFLGDEVRFPFDSSGKSLRVFEWNENTSQKQKQEASLWPASALHDAYRDLGDKVLLIPHVGGRRAIFDWHDPELERLVEVASSWGHFDWFYRDALARGLKVGVAAAGDEHRGRAGGGAPGVGSFGVRGGLTGVLSSSLDVKNVAEALRSRRTWATTGTRIAGLLKSGPHLQGDTFTSNQAVPIEYELYGENGWEWIEVRDDQGVVLSRNLHQELGYSDNRFRIRWGGARIPDRYRWAEWRGVISVTGTRIKKETGGGLEHPEETITFDGTDSFQINTDTYGDADQLEVEVESLDSANIRIQLKIGAFRKTSDSNSFHPDPLNEPFDLTIRGTELREQGVLLYTLNGQDLFISIERVTDRRLPLHVHDNLIVEPLPGIHGHRAIYIYAREQNDDKIWTSPLFINFT